VKHSCMALLVAPLISTSAAAETSSAVQTIVVTANRISEPVETVGQSITVIDTQSLSARQAISVADVLRTVPGVSFARNGGIGTATSVFIRGAESDQTVALIDGVKLNDPSSPGGGFNFGNLLVGNIERIEVLRGPSSVIWGSQAIGGVVNVITAGPSDALLVNVRAEGGWRRTGQIVGNISGRAGPLSVSGGGGYFRTDGFSTFNERRGGQERDGYRNVGANLSLKLDLNDAISIDARSYYSQGRTAIDGFPAPAFAFADTREFVRTRELVGYAGLNAALFDGKLRTRVGYAITDTRRRNIDPDLALPETFTGNGRNRRLEFQSVLTLNEALGATAGIEREVSTFDTESFGGPVSRGRTSTNSIYGQIRISPVNGLILTGGLRHDDHSRFGGATNSAASIIYSFNGDTTRIRASYSEGFKAPTLFQLQSSFGNQSLRPEQAKGWDAGITQRFLAGAIEVTGTYFSRDSRNLITFISCPLPRIGICTGRPSGTFDNVAAARANGTEFTLALRPIDALSISLNHTWLKAENRSVGMSNFGRRLARRPSQTVNAAIDYRWPSGLATGVTITHVGSSFDTASNSPKVEGYVLADVRLAYPVTTAVELYGRVENLFNEKYETIFRFGTPGRAAYVGVRLRL
jgi:vitamin B12 transporter